MGAGGVIVPPRTYFPKIKAVLSKYDILLLADEVICGFGRTGNWFGSQTYDVQPDMMSVAKGLSSGYAPIAATIVGDAVYQAVADEAHRIGVFGHGFTYSGHPVTAAIASEVLSIYREMDVVQRVRELGGYLHHNLRDRLSDLRLVGEIRGDGLIAGIELVEDRETRTPFDPQKRVGFMVERQCRAHGVMIRNMGDALAVCPPFIIEPEEIDALTAGIANAIRDTISALSN
jgi:4-aminobutyrate--pyruvate transaminase